MTPEVRELFGILIVMFEELDEEIIQLTRRHRALREVLKEKGLLAEADREALAARDAVSGLEEMVEPSERYQLLQELKALLDEMPEK